MVQNSKARRRAGHFSKRGCRSDYEPDQSISDATGTENGELPLLPRNRSIRLSAQHWSSNLWRPPLSRSFLQPAPGIIAYRGEIIFDCKNYRFRIDQLLRLGA